MIKRLRKYWSWVWLQRWAMIFDLKFRIFKVEIVTTKFRANTQKSQKLQDNGVFNSKKDIIGLCELTKREKAIKKGLKWIRFQLYFCIIISIFVLVQEKSILSLNVWMNASNNMLFIQSIDMIAVKWKENQCCSYSKLNANRLSLQIKKNMVINGNCAWVYLAHH